MRQVYQNVLQLDEAMTNLRIATRRASDRELAEFSQSAAQSARRLGLPIKEFVDAVTEFARLGYTLKEAQDLAELAVMYARATGVTISEASESITNTKRAFGKSVDDLE